MTDILSILRCHKNFRLSKVWQADGGLQGYGSAKQFTIRETPVGSIGSLSALLTSLEQDPRSCIIRGKFMGEAAAQAEPESEPGYVLRRKGTVFTDQALHAVMVEVDKFEPLSADPVLDPETAVNEYIVCELPECFAGASFHWQLSSSAGRSESAGVLKAHVWFWLRDAYTSEQLRQWAVGSGVRLDPAVLDPIQIHYTALPMFEQGVTDPVPVRSGFVEGLAGDEVPLVLDVGLAGVGLGVGLGGRAGRIRDVLSDDPVVVALRDRGLIRAQRRDGGLDIECPLPHASGVGGQTSTTYFPPHTGGFARGCFSCLHGSCAGKKQSAFLEALGIVEDDRDPDAFEVVAEAGGGGGLGGRGPLEGMGVIPSAKHLCTDQANAGRIVAQYGRKVFVAAGRWHSWDGKRWIADESDVYRFACHLSRIVRAEARAWREKAGLELAKADKYEKIAKSLDVWAQKSEMKGTIEAAVGLAKKMLVVREDTLDRDPWLLNCLNGTVDLRTGVLRGHDPSDYITKLAKVEYDPGATAPLWESVVAQATLEEGMGGASATRPVASFLQRWFGYCATGLTREQQFVVHYGSGSNGKSTILDTVADVLGDYASTAAPGLLMGGGKDRHPAEIAALFGRRMVTAHETSEGGMLREDFIKQATGGDRITARYMHADFFEFSPTHKLQLLTNHKPVIKGQDLGIWRRVLLVPYMARFGAYEEVRAGRAHYVKDVGLQARLLGERVGVLAWVVRGAVQWASDGLQAPDSVLAASKDYQREQDRVLQFVSEMCEVGDQFSEPLTNGMDGLYPSYVGWCKDSGVFALSKNRFLEELLRAVPGSKATQSKVPGLSGKRRDVLKISRVSLLPPV